MYIINYWNVNLSFQLYLEIRWLQVFFYRYVLTGALWWLLFKSKHVARKRSTVKCCLNYRCN